MKKRSVMIVWALLVITVTVLSQVVSRPKPGSPGSWRLIATTQADFKADHDVIVVQGPFDDFRKIKFVVTKAALNLMHMLVTYENGEPDKIEVRQNIPEGGESRVIDLKGAGKRRIRKIEYWYDTKGILKGKANITIFGMK